MSFPGQGPNLGVASWKIGPLSRVQSETKAALSTAAIPGRGAHVQGCGRGQSRAQEDRDTSISFMGNGITHRVRINCDEEDWGSLAEQRGFAYLHPSTARLSRCRKLGLFVSKTLDSQFPLGIWKQRLQGRGPGICIPKQHPRGFCGRWLFEKCWIRRSPRNLLSQGLMRKSLICHPHKTCFLSLPF